jgi:hypothetical protein
MELVATLQALMVGVSAVVRFYPVPQNALYVSAGMNVLKFPKGKP